MYSLNVPKKILFFSLSFGAMTVAHADKRTEKIEQAIENKEQNKKPASFFTFQLDNDLFRDTDHNYTNGIKLQYGRQFTNEDSLNLFENSLRRLLDKTHGDRGGRGRQVYDWSLSLQQYMYTPDSLTALTPPPGERPYSGWLGVEYSMNKHDAHTSSGISISFGVTGDNSLARAAQDTVHKIRGIELFQGWDSQTPAEFTFNVHLNRKHRVNSLERIKLGPIDFDGFLEYGASIGTLRTAAYGGVMIRTGYNLPVDYSVPRLQVASTPPSFYLDDDSSMKSFSAYVFASLRISAVAHDISIDGPIFRDHLYTAQSEPLVGEVIFGLGVRYKHFNLIYARTIRTDEFKGQNSSRHEFGSIQAGLNFRF